MVDPIVIPALIGGWKLLIELGRALMVWTKGIANSKEAKQRVKRALELMSEINKAILAGKHSDDQEVAKLVEEFYELLSLGVDPKHSSVTIDLIDKSYKDPTRKIAAKKPAAKKPAAKKPAAKKPASRR